MDVPSGLLVLLDSRLRGSDGVLRPIDSSSPVIPAQAGIQSDLSTGVTSNVFCQHERASRVPPGTERERYHLRHCEEGRSPDAAIWLKHNAICPYPDCFASLAMTERSDAFGYHHAPRPTPSFRSCTSECTDPGSCTSSSTRHRHRRGYILFETIVAMAVLCAGIITVQAAMRQAVLVRRSAEEAAMARFVLERAMSEIEKWPKLQVGSPPLDFQLPFDGFAVDASIEQLFIDRWIAVPPSDPETGDVPTPALDYMTKVTVWVEWPTNRPPAERHYESIETLWYPEKTFDRRDLEQ